jgi:transcriptional regulator with XRE-family HTH domain
VTGRYQALGEFGARLRRLREDSGLNGKQLAAALSWPHSKVSKIELGRQRPTADEVVAWVAATGAEDHAEDQLADLLIDLRSSRVESAPWRRQLRGGHAPRQRASARLEASAQVIRAFEPAVIPGLLQTADYARQFMTKHAELHQIDSVIEEGVRARMQRQQILYEPDKELRFLVTEATLRYRPCTPSTLRGQLDRLLAVSGLDTVELAILPFTNELPMTTSHGFWIFDDRLVLVETLSSEISLRDQEDVQLYVRHFERLWQVAATGTEARALLTRVLGDLDGTL